jgi:AraC-like DNA-binding protein
MRCDKAYDRRDDGSLGVAARRRDDRADLGYRAPAEVPPEIAIILSSVEDGLSCLGKPDPDLDGVRNLLRVIALAAGAATERGPWPSGPARLDLARTEASLADPAPALAAPLATGFPEIVKGGLSRWQQKRAVSLMARLDQDAPTVSELAAACRLSSGYFIKAFKQTFGVTPRRWRLLLRIEQTKSLLASNDLSIAEIALVCGFADQSHLTRVFGQIVGVPPARWRRRCIDDAALPTDRGGEAARRLADETSATFA